MSKIFKLVFLVPLMERMDVLIRDDRVMKYNKWKAAVPYASAIVYAQNGCLGYAEVLVDYQGIKVNGVGFANLKRLSDRGFIAMGLRERFLVTGIKRNKSRETQRAHVDKVVRGEISRVLWILKKKERSLIK